MVSQLRDERSYRALVTFRSPLPPTIADRFEWRVSWNPSYKYFDFYRTSRYHELLYILGTYSDIDFWHFSISSASESGVWRSDFGEISPFTSISLFFSHFCSTCSTRSKCRLPIIRKNISYRLKYSHSLRKTLPLISMLLVEVFVREYNQNITVTK